MFLEIRNWLTILRIHTANLTMAAVAIGLLLAGESLVSWNSIAFLAWGLLYHAQGFMENCILDLEADRNDPSKRHFALVSGKVPLQPAQTLQMTLAALTLITGGVLAAYHGSWIGAVVLGLAYLTGSGYNHISKKNLSAPLWIMVAFTAVMLFPYVVMSPTSFSRLMAWVAIYTSLQLMYQISVEGYLKDIVVDPVNLLRSLGSRVERVLYQCRIGMRHGPTRMYPAQHSADPLDVLAPPPTTIRHSFASTLYSRVLALAKGFTAFAVVLTQPGAQVWQGIVVFVMYLVIFLLDSRLMRDGPFDNAVTVRYCSLIEVLSYFALVVALWPTIGAWYVCALILLPVVWFLAMNQVIWGAWRPRV